MRQLNQIIMINIIITIMSHYYDYHFQTEEVYYFKKNT